jgi:hypothetical protein
MRSFPTVMWSVALVRVVRGPGWTGWDDGW